MGAAQGAWQCPLPVKPPLLQPQEPPALCSLLAQLVGQWQQRVPSAAACDPQLIQAHPNPGDMSQTEPFVTSALSWCHRCPRGAGVLLRDPKSVGITREEPDTQHLGAPCSSPGFSLPPAPAPALPGAPGRCREGAPAVPPSAGTAGLQTGKARRSPAL